MMARVLQTRVISFKRDSPRIVKGCLWYAPVHGGTWTFDGFFFYPETTAASQGDIRAD